MSRPATFFLTSISMMRDETGIEETQMQNASQVISQIYPNPAKTFLTICSSTLVQSIKIYDVVGKLVKTEKFAEFKDKGEISLKNIRSGVYFLKVNTEDTEFTKKLIVTK